MSRWVNVDGDQVYVSVGITGLAEWDTTVHVGPGCECRTWIDGEIDPACWDRAVEAGHVAWSVWRPDPDSEDGRSSWLPRLAWRVADDPMVPGQQALFETEEGVTW